VRGKIGNEGFAVLCKAPALANLRSLNVTANDIEAEGIEALGDRLPELKTLVLTANEIGDEGLEWLVKWKHLGQVETLYLSSCALSADGVAALLAGKLTSLRKITLSANNLGEAVAAVFAKRAAALPALRHIELVSTDIDSEAAATLAKKLPSVARIDVRRNAISDDEVGSPRVRAG
jgi:Leucine Rich repeat